MIWEFAVGSQYIHVKLLPKLGHRICDPGIWKSSHLAQPSYVDGELKPKPVESFKDTYTGRQVLGGLIFTCKQM